MGTLKRYVVPAGREGSIRDVLAHVGVDAQAVTEGRVFVGRKRVTREDETVRQGDIVEVGVPRARESLPHVRVLAQTEDLVVVDKPAGIPTIADHGGAAHALTTLTAQALGIDAGRLHATS